MMPVVVVKKRTRKGKRAPKQQQVSKSKQTLLGTALRSLGSAGGTALGGYFGNPLVGASVGNSLGAALSKWLGAGDYVVTKNSILAAGPTIPAMHNTGQSITIRHKEFVGAVVGSTGFTVQNVLTLNPGLSETFPWLSRIAVSFQEYSFKGAVYHYVPTSGNAISGTNAAIGSVMLQTSYRSTENKPLSKTEMLNEYWASEGPPNETFAHPVECAPAENPFKVQYVRSAGVGDDSLLMYDLGKTFVATQGMPADGNPVGDLWITYEVELRKPVLRSSVSPASLVLAGGSTGVTTTTLFTGAVFAPTDYGVTSTGNTIVIPTLPPGTYVYTLDINSVPGPFTAVENGASLTISGASETSFSRNTLGGTTPTLNRALRIGKINVPTLGPVSITFPTFTLTPASSLTTVFTLVAAPGL